MSAIEEIILPDVGGEAVDVIEICVTNGDSFEEEDAIIVVETDKASMDIPASFAGTIENMNIKVGDKITEGTVICTVKRAASESDDTPEVTKQPEVAKKIDAVEKLVDDTPKPIKESISTVIEDVYIPDIGGDSDVAVIEVMISVGDHVDFDDGLITLETEKASMDVPAPFAGEILEVFIQAGDKASAGTLVAKIQKQVVTTNTTDKETIPNKTIDNKAAIVKIDNTKKVDTPSTVLATKATRVHASPSVRKIAREFGVDLTFVKGSARKNRIIKDDIKAYVKEQLNKPASTNGAELGFNLPPLKEIDFSKFGEIETVELSRIQKISGPTLHRNALSIPHIAQFDEANITELEKFRKEQNAIADGFKLSPLVFVVKAVAKALELYPKFNSSLSSDGNTLIMKKYFNIAIAVDTPNGLVVPVIKDVDKKGFKEIALAMAEISAKARDGKLKAQDMQGASFTISSLGGIGGTYFTPIINAPEVAILGLSKSEMKPKWNGKEFEPALMLPLSLSYDHKVIDGADGARFTTTLAKLLGDIRLLNL
tara:strand:- start:2414 stop:4036 length:1623 start_codon:yes stop_codon:yes gene_type:complete